MSVSRSEANADRCHAPVVDRERLDDLLVKTSRTFALSIPVLPEPTGLEVTVAYLLFRIADTLEDATLWSRERKLAELREFASMLQAPPAHDAGAMAARWVAEPPIDHDGYVELLADTTAVVQAHGSLEDRARDEIATHTCRTIDGMAGFVARERDGVLTLTDLDDLRAYCYVVAGIVGEMLTELFLLRCDAPESITKSLRRDASTFGEALQLVNILKDSSFDAREGRFYLPADVERVDVLNLARSDLRIAGRYSQNLMRVGAPRGVIEFTALPVMLAWAALERVEQSGPGSKITRAEVMEIVARLPGALERNDLQGILPIANNDEEST